MGVEWEGGADRNHQWVTWVANGLTVGEFGAAFTCSTALCEIYRHPFLPDGGSLKLRDQSVKWITVPHLPPWVASVCVTHLSN